MRTHHPIDGIIEVYMLENHICKEVFYREIPVGSTYNEFTHLVPAFIFKVRFKPGYSLPIDQPVKSYILEWPKVAK